MDLQPYVDVVRHELTLAAAAAGPDAQQLAERLSAPLDSALRLALLEALSSATEEISGELGSGSVEVRLRGRDPEFVVDVPDDSAEPAEPLVYDEDGGATWRITLRLPEGLRAPVEAAARRDGTSLNGWLVRVAAKASQGPNHHARKNSHRVTGWVR
ncbi:MULTISPECIES: histidine kinase [Mycobacterium]|uniref:Histidine kinase n=1 Tax=Mycobacterium kiyosense TaxID=2871094 RepID=A0A9P3UY91_9MYCO|nr:MULTISPECIES: histidine kinase [Mycobacterium]BDB43540.1 hypothetical protein IWGMT90018_39860 [Mycobacterium kiyosense]BDE13301.1 hypothetical protein MKCMC460_21610 [Mycobacterium sp. 20KCMC460]GLB83924.1 hypothetical protein SRL2020028_31800 [Mycobacterium kiyosense]GLB90875.1 hypothetical protein SRL2020130_36920 [Mycobacterium kiyosense]GLB96438.1 hypothetical protein SRL2020226_32140 [Mycobacterium kiyosense]